MKNELLKKAILGFILILSSEYSFAQQSFSNTLRYTDTIKPPQSDVEVMQWIQGHWRGEAFGGITEEVWTPGLGGSMMCAFKLVVNGEVKFYEIVTISEEGGSLILRLKHFHSDLKGWEEKDEAVDFKLIKVTPSKVYFDGFTFEKVNDNELNIYVIIDDKGNESEMKFNYQRVG